MRRFLQIFASLIICVQTTFAGPEEICTGNCVHGFGRLKLADDAVFEGTFKDRKFDGKGILKKQRRGKFSTYNGDWLAGVRHGTGTQVFVSGGRYVGEWQKDRMSGKGVFTSVLGKCDFFEVLARENSLPIDSIAQGDWFVDYCIYDGNWVNSWPHGYGTLTLKFDILRVGFPEFYEKIKSMPMLSYLVALQKYDRLPAHIQIVGNWSKGQPDKSKKITVRDGKGNIFYEGYLDLTKQH